MFKQRGFILRVFKCPVCGAIMTATKRGHKTGLGHIKDMWCWRCKETRKFEQIDTLGRSRR